MTAFSAALDAHGQPPLTRGPTTWLQVNLGKRCNQACRHCHVDASPSRTEMMSAALIDDVIGLMHRNPGIQQLDVTGGAPEMHPDFRRLVRAGRAAGRTVVDRCNLTILSEPGHEDLADFLAEQGVQVVSSLPCYLQKNVDRQRGKGVFDRSIAALRQLNARGFGMPGTGLVLDLVYNPVGAHLPPEQGGLEADYRERLGALGIQFTRLLTITNMPIARYLADLRRQGEAEAYQSLLVQAFNPATLPGLMCRSLLSVSWDGRLYDCDFNQMLELGLVAGPDRLQDLGTLADLDGTPVAVGAHCFGCTAGAGSSCGGALA